MVSFQRSKPPNFISFPLEEQTFKTTTAPNLPEATNSRNAIDQAPELQDPVREDNSPQSAISEPDVNIFAKKMVRQMESKHQESAESLDLADG